jgi:hypothetical protein
MFPDFFIVGAAKCGTTALYHYLDRHPDVYMSPIKEPNHFCTDIRVENFSAEFKRHEKEKNLDLEKYLSGDMKQKHWGYFVTDKEDYKKLFKNRTSEKAAGEVSNSYLFSKTAAAAIRADVPEAKIIIMLRNPAERAWSHYIANLRDGKTFLPFREELQNDSRKMPKGWGQSYLYLEMGFYFEQVKRYMDIFPASQMKIFLYDDFKKNAAAVMEEVFSFLGIRSTGGPFSEKFNEAREPLNSRLLYMLSRTGLKKKVFHAIPSPLQKKVKDLFFRKTVEQQMNPADRRHLLDIYREDICKLEGLIERDLKSWLV